jgi:hypothetical protein
VTAKTGNIAAIIMNRASTATFKAAGAKIAATLIS